MATFQELKAEAIEQVVSATARRPTPPERRRRTAEWGIDAQLDLVKIVYEMRPRFLDDLAPNHIGVLRDMGVSSETAHALVRAFINELRG